MTEMTTGQHSGTFPLLPSSKRMLSARGYAIWLTLFVIGSGCAYGPTSTKGQVIAEWKANTARTASESPSIDAKSPITLSGAIGLAKQQNRALLDLRARVPMTEAGIELASQWNDPELRITDVALNDLIDGEPTLEIALRFPIEQPGTLSAQRAVKVLDYQDLMARIHAFEHRLSVAISKTFHTLALIQLDRDEVEREIAVRSSHLELVKRRLEAGVGVEVDLALATLPHARALDERNALQNKEREQRALLARLLAVPEVGQLKLPELPLTPPEGPSGSEQSVIERALRSRSELDQATFRLEQAKAKTFAAKQRRWPWPDFAQLSYEVRHPLQPLRYGVAVALKVPLFEWMGSRVTLHEAEVALLGVRVFVAIFLARFARVAVGFVHGTRL